MAASGSRKSTIVRSFTLAGFRALDLAAPSVGAALVERIWFRIPRGMPLAEPTGTPFEVRWQGRTLRGQVWGSGPVVYLVHGWGGNADQMRGFVAPLVASGFRVVAHDAPSHGRSDAGRHGAESSDAVELGQALDAVATEFGPAHTIVAHSLGTLATLLALRDGWFTAERLVLIAPVDGVPWFTAYFRRLLGFGDRTQRHTDRRIERRTGYRPDELETRLLATQLERPELLVVHDLDDRSPGMGVAADLVAGWPGAGLVETTGLGHNRVLADPGVIGSVVDFVLDDRLLVQPSATSAGLPAEEPSGHQGDHDRERRQDRQGRDGRGRTLAAHHHVEHAVVQVPQR
jgi:pimeloyl-ACP methyl ester carboxylesterase